ncbi:MAG: laccase [Rickettsiales bacterium]|nr:MAG: laccase [Rickettsiales bacterium]
MELEFIKNKVYYKIFDRTYTGSTGVYSKHKHKDAAKLAEIQQNIDNIKNKYDAQGMVLLKQVHGTNVVLAGSECSDYPEADGSVTCSKGVALSIMTADCVPVLFASADGAVIGAAHCGWRSAKAGIVARIRENMEAQGGKDIKAIIAPSIQQASYEVDTDYHQAFIKDDETLKALFIPSTNKGRYMFDLAGYVKRMLEQENIELKLHIDEDTYSMQEKYPSYRRSHHKGEQYSQSILSTIMIK